MEPRLGFQDSETLRKFFLLPIWDRVPGSWKPGSASVLRNLKPAVGSVPRNSGTHSDLPENERKTSTKYSNGLRNAQKSIFKWVPFSRNGNPGTSSLEACSPSQVE
jgi:hypothetical protein